MTGAGDRGPAERILVVEDDPTLRRAVAEVLQAEGYEVLTSADGLNALWTLGREPIDVVITDLDMPGLRGEDLVRKLRTDFPWVPVIVISGSGSIPEAVAVVLAGAADYLPKPFRTPDVLDSLRRILEGTRAQRERRRLTGATESVAHGMTGYSPGMRRLFDQIDRFARNRAPVLIVGETGSGKELAARAIHRASGRSPFVPVNCGAIPANLLETELFGHVRGAFTGATRDHAGLFEIAQGGTLFLDEIVELPLQLQPKLLRALQSGEVRRVGDVKSRQFDVRVIAATHRDLAGLVAQGTFRQDLFYRINVLRLDVPPLRERGPDITLLAQQFLDDLCRREGLPPKAFTPEALAVLVAHSWPGNVRELLNTVERAALLGDGTSIDVPDLPPELRAGAARDDEPDDDGAPPGLNLAHREQEDILRALELTGGNRSRAATLLGISRRTLYRKLQAYGIRKER